EFFAVRRKSNVGRTAALIGRDIVVRSGGKVARRCAPIRGNNKEVAALPFVPVRPVPVEQMFRNVSFYFVLFLFRIALTVAVIVLAIGVYRRSEGNRLSIR